MSEFADALGLPDRIRHAAWKRDKDGKPILGDDGKPLREPARDFLLSSPDDFEVMGSWELYLEHEAWHVLQRRYSGPENATILNSKENELNVSIVAGDYSYHSEAAIKSMGNVMSKGFRKYIYFCLCPHIGERQAEWISEEFQREQKSELFRVHRKASGVMDPKDKAPEGALPSDVNGSLPSSQSLSTPVSPIQPSGAT